MIDFKLPAELSNRFAHGINPMNSGILADHVREWCDNNCIGPWKIFRIPIADGYFSRYDSVGIRFVEERDAVLFKTFWL